LRTVKAKYKALGQAASIPDANGGDRSTEDRLIEIIKAYNYLKTVVRRRELVTVVVPAKASDPRRERKFALIAAATAKAQNHGEIPKTAAGFRALLPDGVIAPIRCRDSGPPQRSFRAGN